MNVFPLIRIPHRLATIETLLPPIPEFREKTPTYPTPPQRFNQPRLWLESCAALVISALVGTWHDGLWASGILTGAAFAIGLQSWQQARTFPHRLSRYPQVVADYQQQLTHYQTRQQTHQAAIHQLRSPQGIADYRRQRLVEQLRSTVAPNVSRQGSRGESERAFGLTLRRYFGSYILTGRALSIPNFAYPYSPDFIYHDPKVGLYIDIEIDEPYDHKAKQPTHTLGSDDRRDQFFLDRGWIVVRFAEEQVVLHPQSCCKVIATLLTRILNDPDRLNPFAQTPDLQPIPRWNRSQALRMAAQNVRQQLRSINQTQSRQQPP